MINRNRTILAGACLLFAAASRLPAQSNAAEIYGGYTYIHANPETPLPRSGMSGWNVGAAGFANKWFGAGFEFSGVFGSLQAPASTGLSGVAINTKEYSYLVGPEVRFFDKDKVQASLKWMIGGVFGQASVPSSTPAANSQVLSAAGYQGFNETKLGMMFALPIDAGVSRLFGIRVEPAVYMTDFAPLASGGNVATNQHQWNFRVSIGPVFRLGHGK